MNLTTAQAITILTKQLGVEVKISDVPNAVVKDACPENDCLIDQKSICTDRFFGTATIYGNAVFFN